MFTIYKISSLSSSSAVSSEMLISAFETGSRISVFQSRASRREREFLSFSLMLRDENEIFFLSVSCFETRTGISFFQSRASRQAREFVHLISGFEMRARNSVISSQFSRRERDFEDEEVYPWFLLRNPHFTWWFSSPLLSVCNSFLFFFSRMKVKVVYLRVQPMLS